MKNSVMNLVIFSHMNYVACIKPCQNPCCLIFITGGKVLLWKNSMYQLVNHGACIKSYNFSCCWWKRKQEKWYDLIYTTWYISNDTNVT